MKGWMDEDRTRERGEGNVERDWEADSRRARERESGCQERWRRVDGEMERVKDGGMMVGRERDRVVKR